MTTDSTETSSSFLEDDKGNQSTIRLMSFIALIAAIGFGYLAAIHPSSPDGIYITFGFLLSAFAPKVLQKYIEGMPAKK